MTSDKQKLRAEYNSLKKEIKRNLDSIYREVSKNGFISIGYIEEKLNAIKRYSGDIANVRNSLGTK